MKPLKILGAGFSGLTLAYFLKKENPEIPITIYEKIPHKGGLLKTHSNQFHRFEQAANAVLASKLLEEVSEDLKIEITPAKKVAKTRWFVGSDNQFRKWPLGMGESISFLLGALKLKVLSIKASPNELASEFFDRQLGRGARRKLLDLGLQGIYATTSQNLSAELIHQNFFSPEMKKEKGRFRGSVSFSGGLSEFLEALSNKLQKDFQVDFVAQEITELSPQDSWALCTSMNQSRKLLVDNRLMSEDQFGGLNMKSLVSVCVSSEIGSDPYLGFGCLFEESSDFSALGVLKNHNIFEDRSKISSETWILPGKFVREEDAVIQKLVRQDRRRMLQAAYSEEKSIDIFRWPDTLPSYDLNLEAFLRRQDYLKLEDFGLFLHGNYLGGIGLSSILHRSQKLAFKIAEFLRKD